ncbi:MAG: MFS transporter [Pseudomonadota bacterium]
MTSSEQSTMPDTKATGGFRTTLRDEPQAVRAVGILFWAQSVLGAQMPMHLILGGLAGALLAENDAFATLPVSMMLVGSMLGAPLMAAIMQRFGRRTGFLLAALAGAAGGGLAAEAIIAREFWMLCCATALTGLYMAGHNFYRFAASDLASKAFRPKAISLVMAGGLLAALIGPELVRQTQDWLEPIPFAGAYRVMVLINLLGAIPLLFLDIPRPPQRKDRKSGSDQPLLALLSQRKIAVPILCAMVSYTMMLMVMTATPLAMIACGFGTADAADAVQVHVLAMFAPSFVTGSLIARYGAERIVGLGLALLLASSLVALSGIEIAHFTVAMILLGVGWNFGFVGATTMLAAAHEPEDRGRVQGANDFLVMALVTLGSFSAGALLAVLGWSAVNLAVMPFLALAAGALIWFTLTEPARA